METAIFTTLTIGLTIGLSIAYILPRRKEIMTNWGKYKTDPFIMFGAPFFKPDDDPRSYAEFASDNFMDVMSSLSNKVFLVFLQPVFQLFVLFTTILNSVLNNIFGFRELIKNMFQSLMRIFEPFMARFRTVGHELRKTFIRLKDAISRVAAVTTAAIFAGLSTIRTMLNLFELMKTVVVAILIILLVLVIWFWFILWPLIPIIVLAISALQSAGNGDSVNGMAGTFCFAEDTQILLEDGTTVPIKSIPLNALLKGGGTVEATMVFHTDPHPFYSYKGIIVSGSHIVYEPEPCFVEDSVHATRTEITPTTYYCLTTSTRRIPVQSPTDGMIEFADWEELEQEDHESLIHWHKQVEQSLNRCIISTEYPSIMLESEAILSPSTLIQTLTGLQPLSEIQPGMWIYNSEGTPIRVLGVVKMDSSNIAGYHTIGRGSLSCSCWVRPPGYTLWKPLHSFSRMFPLIATSPSSSDPWISLFTEDGTFLLGGGWAVRDFTDVGPAHIAETHPETLHILKQRYK